jgi:hypothetical protein
MFSLFVSLTSRHTLLLTPSSRLHRLWFTNCTNFAIRGGDVLTVVAGGKLWSVVVAMKWQRFCWKSTDISEEHIAPIFRVEDSAEQKLVACKLRAGFLFSLLLEPEDGGYVSIRNVGWLSLGYTALDSRRQNFSRCQNNYHSQDTMTRIATTLQMVFR